MSNSSKVVTVLVLILVVASIGAEIRDEQVAAARQPSLAFIDRAVTPWRLREIRHVRPLAQRCSASIGGYGWSVSRGVPLGPRYRRWVLDLWRDRLTGCQRTTRLLLEPARAIRWVFGEHGDNAIRVASCESHLSVWARNGQYYGMFQMGEFARSNYGHDVTPLGQAQAAYRYFVASGRDWSPWSCKP